MKNKIQKIFARPRICALHINTPLIFLNWKTETRPTPLANQNIFFQQHNALTNSDVVQIDKLYALFNIRFIIVQLIGKLTSFISRVESLNVLAILICWVRDHVNRAEKTLPLLTFVRL